MGLPGEGILEGVISSGSAKDASDAQAQAAKYAADIQYKMFEESNSLQEPFRQGGMWALEQLIGTEGMAKDMSTQNYNDPDIFKVIDSYGSFDKNVLPKKRLSMDSDEYYQKHKAEYDKLIPEGVKLTDIEGWREWVNDPYAVDKAGKKLDTDIWSAAKTAVEGGQTTFQNPRQLTTMGEPVGGLLGAGGGAPELDFDSFKDSPWYTLQRDEGIRALESSAAGSGMLQSGNFGKALTNYGSDYAYGKALDVHNTETNDWINTQLNPLLAILGAGQVASGQMGSNAMQAGTNMGQAALYGGEAKASGYLGQASSWQNALSRESDNAAQTGAILANFYGG